jgi:hypothetical protein
MCFELETIKQGHQFAMNSERREGTIMDIYGVRQI